MLARGALTLSLLTASASVAAALLAASASVAAADVWKESYAVGSKPTLRLRSADGNVVIRPGARGTIDVRIETRNYEIGRDLKVRARQSGDEVEIIIERPRVRPFDFGMRQIDVDIVVPERLDLDVTTGDGSLTAEGLRGRLELSSGDGRVQATDLGGDLDISTGDGAVTGTGLDGRVSLHTGDGPVRVSGRFEGLQIHTGDGRVQVDVDDRSRMADPWSISTGDGPVTLRLSPDLAADLYVHTGDGSIDVDATIDLSGGARRHELRGRLNGGGPKLSVVTGDGSVRVTQRRSPAPR